MASDPLSAATRATKRNLLAVSSVVILIKVFDVSINKIPLSGLELTFDRGAVMFGLLAMLCYFFLAFLLYYWIDIRSNVETDYEGLIRKNYRDRMNAMIFDSNKCIEKHVQSILPSGYKIFLNELVLQKIRSEALKLNARIDRNLLLRSGGVAHGRVAHVMAITVGDGNGAGGVIRFDNGVDEGLFNRAEQELIHAICEYRRNFWKERVRLLTRYTIRKSAFVLRNYGFDGVIPLAMAATSLATAYDWVSLSWIKALVPPAG